MATATASGLGIEVPEGDPRVLEDASAALSSIAGALSQVTGEFSVGAPVGWSGAGALGFTDVLLTQAGVAREGAAAMDQASAALKSLAHDLHVAQKACRRELELAGEAKDRGDRARTAATAAGVRLNAARLSAAASAERAAMAEIASLPSSGDRVAQQQSNAAADAAFEEQGRQTRLAGDADEHLRDAQRRGRDAREEYERNAAHVASRLTGLAAQAPIVRTVCGTPVAAVGGPGHPPVVVPVAVTGTAAPGKKGDGEKHGGLGKLAHALLGGASVFPGVSVLTGGADALLYAAEGDSGGAALAGATMLPGGKLATSLAKGAKELHAAEEAARAAKAAKEAREAKAASGAAEGGVAAGVAASAKAWRDSAATGTKKLRAAMSEDVAAGHAAHHIVPRGAYANRSDRLALERAQAALHRLGIGPDDAANGVSLPSGFHSRVHTDDYFKRLADDLDVAESREDAEDILAGIADDLRAQASGASR